MMGTVPQTALERRSRRKFLAGVVAIVLFMAATIGAVFYLTSDSFRNYVRGRVVAQLQEITGGRVELGRLDWNLSKLQVEAQNLTIHGLEPAGDLPYAHVDHMLLQLKVFSLLDQDLGIRYLVLDRPVIHLMVFPDGHTNQPVPPKARLSPGPKLEQLFHLELDRTEIRGGLLIINEQRLPLDASARNVMAEMSYAARQSEYQGTIKLGSLAVHYGDWLPTQLGSEFEFNLRHDQLEVKSAKVSTPKSSVRFSGMLSNFSAPALDINFNASVDLSESGIITRTSELQKGSAGIRGSFQYSAGNYSSAGKLNVQGLEYQDKQLSLHDVDAAADYNLSPKRIAVRNLVSRALGGTLRGEGAVDNWLAAARAKPAVKGTKSLPVQQVGSVQLRLENVSVRELLRSVSTPSLQLHRLNASGAVNGSANLHWRGAISTAIAGFDATVTPPAIAGNGVLPVGGEIHGSYELARKHLNLSQINLNADGMQARGSGSIGPHSEQIELHLSVRDLSTLQPILSAVGVPEPSLEGLTGQGAFHGTIANLTNESRIINGHVELHSASLPLAAVQQHAGTKRAPASVGSNERIGFDFVSADIAYSPDGVVVRNGVARQQQSKAAFDFSASLSKGEFSPRSRIFGHISLQNEDIAEMQKVLGYEYPVQGRISATLQISGTDAAPQASGHVQVSDAVFYEETAKSISADVSLSPDRISALHVVVIQNGGRITASGHYDPDTSAFQFQATGENLDLAKVHHLERPNLHLRGKVSFTANGAGTAKEPVINADVRATKLVVNQQSIGDLHLNAETKGETLQLMARSDFERAIVNIDGIVQLRGDFPAQLKMTFSDFDLAPFLPSQAGVTTRMAGNIVTNGPLRELNKFSAAAEISDLIATVHGIKLANNGPIRMTINAQELRIENLKVQGEDTELTAAGTIALTGRKQIRLSASGHVNMHLAQTLDPDLVTSGTVTLNVDIAGTTARPRMLGQVSVANGTVALIDLPNGLSNINGTLIFDQDQLSVQSMTARTGGGDVHVGGYIAYRNELSFNLTADGKDIRLRYPQGVSSSADMSVRLAGTLKNSTLSGDITVTRFGITQQFDLALYLARSKMAPPAPNPDSPAYNLHLDMHVVSTPELQVQTTVGRLAGDVDLRVRGTAAKPVVLGRINITEGQIAFNGTNYELRRGDILFANPVGIVPVLNVEAATRIRNYDITLTFHGDVNHLATNYRSDPPLPEGDVISLLAFGRTREETDLSSNSGFALNGTVSNALLGEALNSAVGDRVQKLFGVSRIKISPDYATTTTNPTAQVTIEQQVSKKITVTYITSLTQTTYSQQAIQVEYSINRDVSVVGGRDLYGILSFDVKVRQRKK